VDSIIQNKLDRAIRVRDHSLAYPATVTGFGDLVKALTEGVARLELLATQEQSGYLAATAATATKTEEHDGIRGELGLMAGIARGASGEKPELPQRFRLPRANINHPTFLATTRAILEQAMGYKEIFVRDGMPASFIEDLTARVARYEAAHAAQDSATALHVAARVELREVLRQITLIVKRLDGINRVRFRNNPEQLAVWARAKYLNWPAPSATASKPAPKNDGKDGKETVA
jgi:hypothetical protein